MFLRCHERRKNGKEHRYWSVVENKRVSGGRVVQRQILYLGEINDSQQETWQKTIEIFEKGCATPRTVALFPEDRATTISDVSSDSYDFPTLVLPFGLALEFLTPHQEKILERI